jgi:hypothetical protein
MVVLYVPYFAFVDQDAISVGDGFDHLDSGLGLLVVQHHNTEQVC